jgi:uncharacterized protein YndB with AHSA1/START domain
MMPTPDDTSLTMTRNFNAPPDKVFSAWSNPDLLKVWMGGKAVTSPFAEVDFRVGGKYTVRLQPPYGESFTVEGTYQEIDPPKKLVYTWVFVGAEIETGETLVTVEFEAQKNGTQVTLQHEKLPNSQIRDIHNGGWTDLLDNLSDLIEML